MKSKIARDCYPDMLPCPRCHFEPEMYDEYEDNTIQNTTKTHVFCPECGIEMTAGYYYFNDPQRFEEAARRWNDMVKLWGGANAIEKAYQPDRATILDKAKQCVCGDREQDYGSPAENFQTIANLWIDYLSGTGQPVDITPKDVAIMMSLVKIARITSGKAKEDNWIDACGYLALGAEIEAQERG